MSGKNKRKPRIMLPSGKQATVGITGAQQDVPVIKAKSVDEALQKFFQSKDDVNHPAHYKANGIESIDVIEAFGLGFHLGNVVKYVLRSGRKTPNKRKDLEKARWYLNREIDNLIKAGE